MNGKLYLGKINLSKINKDKIFNGKEGNKWIDVTVWVNDEPDEYGNNMAIQQSTKSDESKIYLGNCKEWKPEGKAEEPKAAEPTDLPF